MYHGKFNARLLSREGKHTYIGNTIFSFFFPANKERKIRKLLDRCGNGGEGERTISCLTYLNNDWGGDKIKWKRWGRASPSINHLLAFNGQVWGIRLDMRIPFNKTVRRTEPIITPSRRRGYTHLLRLFARHRNRRLFHRFPVFTRT